jgi:hypothetical protein
MGQSVVRIRPVILKLGEGDVDILHKLNAAGLLDKIGILRTPSTPRQDFALQRALVEVHPSLYFVSDLPLGDDLEGAKAILAASREAGTKVQLLPTGMPQEVCASLLQGNGVTNLIQILSNSPTREEVVSAAMCKLHGVVVPQGSERITRNYSLSVISRLESMMQADVAKEAGAHSVIIPLALIKNVPIGALNALLTIFQQDT